MNTDWNPALYQKSHAFVWQYGRDLLDLLAPAGDERILDAGCGTGQLTAEIARSGAAVTGIDASAAMIGQARANYPELQFEVQDVRMLPYREELDAVFSNAALHWVHEARAAAASIARALKPGGRFVAEFGGKGNVQAILNAADAGNPWYFPSIAAYAAVLESSGLEVVYAALFDRPTKLDGPDGMRKWFEMFGAALLPAEGREEFLTRVEQRAAPELRRGGVWYADYRRLRVQARRI